MKKPLQVPLLIRLPKSLRDRFKDKCQELQPKSSMNREINIFIQKFLK